MKCIKSVCNEQLNATVSYSLCSCTKTERTSGTNLHLYRFWEHCSVSGASLRGV